MKINRNKIKIKLKRPKKPKLLRKNLSKLAKLFCKAKFKQRNIKLRPNKLLSNTQGSVNPIFNKNNKYC